MKTEVKLQQYLYAVRVYLRQSGLGYHHADPKPADYGLTTDQEVWLTKRKRAELVKEMKGNKP